MKTVFPTTYSTLCPLALGSLIAEKYNLADVRCTFLLRGVGDTYLVETSGDRFVCRIYRSSHRSLPQIQEEVTLLLALKAANVAVSYPITDTAGETIQQLPATEGIRGMVLFSYAPGRSVKPLNENQLKSLGREMARFHNVSSTIKRGDSRWHFDTDTTLFKPLQQLAPFFSGDPESYACLQEIAHRVAGRLSQLDASNCPTGYCHFDFLPKNIHFDGDTITLFDFDFAGYGWVVNDLAVFWQHLAIEVFTRRMEEKAMKETFATLLESYREHRSLSAGELAAVPYLALGFWLFYMGFHTTHDQFYAQLAPAHLKVITGFLKHIADTYWEKKDI